MHLHNLMITPNKTVRIFRVYTKSCSISCVTLNNPNYGVQNPVYHVVQPQLWGSKLRLPRSEPYLPRYITPFTTLYNPIYHVVQPQLWGSEPHLPRCATPIMGFGTPFTTLYNPNYGVLDPINALRNPINALGNPVNGVRDPVNGVQDEVNARILSFEWIHNF